MQVMAMVSGHELALAAAVRDADGLDGIALRHGWATTGLQALTAAAFVAQNAGDLALAIVGLPLGVRNPVELAEQLITVDHAWRGRFSAGLAIGTPAECAAFGIQAQLAAPRFEEGLGILRAMWTQEALEGAGPQYVFGEVHPTLRPARPDGPPLSLHAATPDAAVLAARLGLGLDVASDASTVADLADTYRAAGGVGAIAAACDAADLSTTGLQAFEAVGVARVIVRPSDGSVGAIAQLAERLASARG